ncbi:MAG: GNAT family N-acetyltransferase [Candidatus Altiarchaeales archaeon]|nr:GNAT family N-acetyltransferase [Candidatus Altiarchaeales archaeon]
MDIREGVDSNLEDILSIESAAFGEAEGPVIVGLVRDLLSDPTAKPLLSLVAFQDEVPVGHILFTKVRVLPKDSVSAVILAPMAVLPSSQKKGIGGKLIETGFNILSERGVDLVFVLGYPSFYSRSGFQPAGRLGYTAPYPIAKKNEDAWMVKKLSDIKETSSRIECAKSLDKPEYWIE